MAEIDLDAIRAARLEVEKTETHQIKFKGQKFPLCEELPWDLAEGLAVDDYVQVVAGIKQLFGDNWNAFRALGPSRDDVIAIAFAAAAKLGVKDLGESEASGASSTATTKPSRRTSSASTRSTSGKPSGARTASRSAKSAPS